MEKQNEITNPRAYSLAEFTLHLFLSALAAFFVLTINMKSSIAKLIAYPAFERYFFKNMLMCAILIGCIKLLRNIQRRFTMRQQIGVVILGFMLILLIAYGQCYLYFMSEGVHFKKINYFNTLFPLTLLFLLLVYLIQVVWETILFPMGVQYNLIPSPATTKGQTIKASHNKKAVNIYPHNLCLLVRDGSYLHAYDFENKYYRVYYSIRAINALLQDYPDYFMINTGAIVHKSVVHSFTDKESFALFVFVEVNGEKRRLTVTRSRRKEFIIWVKGDPSLTKNST
jgi:hypothetical protein